MHEETVNWRESSAFFVMAWRIIMFAAAIAVLLDHRQAIRDLGIKPSVICRRWMLYSRLAEHLVVGRTGSGGLPVRNHVTAARAGQCYVLVVSGYDNLG